MKNIFKILIISAITFLFSCEKTVYVDIPDNDPKLVAQSFLSPSSKYIDVYLTWSVPIYGTYDWKFNDEKNADVYIIKNGKKTKLTYQKPAYEEENSFYRVDASAVGIATGDNISMDITGPNGEKISSSTTIPGKAKYELTFEKLDSNLSDYYNYIYSFIFKAKNTDTYNYYRISAKGYKSRWQGTQLTIDSVYLYDISDHGQYYKLEENNSILLKYSAYETYDSIKIIVLHTDDAYYYYHNSVYNFDGENPFAEPVLVYSNINGGLGVFCSYNYSFKSFKF